MSAQIPLATSTSAGDLAGANADSVKTASITGRGERYNWPVKIGRAHV